MADPEEPLAGHVHVLLPRASVHARGVPGDAAIAGGPSLDELLIADPPSRWAALGFTVGEDGACDIGTVRLQLGALGDAGIAGWALRGVEPGTDFDGLATVPSGAPERPPAPEHPNGALRVDHVVVATPDIDRTLRALRSAGLEVRRERGAGPSRRQAFLWVGDTILEVVGPRVAEGPGPARFWGLVVVVADLDAACARLGELVSAPRDAVQPGRRIATVGRQAGLGSALALMTPHTPG